MTAGLRLSGAPQVVSVANACMVCFDRLVEAGNEIVYCSHCGIGVHQACYGLCEYAGWTRPEPNITYPLACQQ